MERQLVLRHGDLELTATLHYPFGDNAANEEKKGAVLICHGFVGNRIGVDRLFVKTARAIASKGRFVLRFDYGGCGESSGDYGALGFSSMIDQTRTALDYLLGMDCVDPSRVVLLGHSLGGAVALHTAIKDKRVSRLVLWSAVAYPFNDIVRIVGRDQYDRAVITGSADHAGYLLQPAFFESLQQHQPFQAASRFNGDVLLVHGTSDDSIPADYSFLYQKLFWTRSEGQCDKEIIFQADHTFSSFAHQQEAIRVTSSWIEKQEKSQEEWHHWSI
ncbi:alpha/beta hydrolase family protein [Paenibacillus beijingensis]|uniref:Permease n=1 Tax=Paenibacillus beijingensis TaxID=1126833 RepID=A0A0D5NQF8_9BACL|nr:alpha/beta fold hydrolase [Paenibacillus beijingensis]AJY77559.1 permease [Paenibacillus beijingensis]